MWIEFAQPIEVRVGCVGSPSGLVDLKKANNRTQIARVELLQYMIEYVSGRKVLTIHELDFSQQEVPFDQVRVFLKNVTDPLDGAFESVFAGLAFP